ncbi:hypothetical protein BB559_000198 [Furculomyces boomerangus]|uniref:Uncharacterized protein n=1 Tax=Furculomyces boomerangus TaxID=61424 RepID=A0A2T9Z5Y2_9FUNG|nr:hypothetical protein BB559_000198 [Furculomyces boomerangus]
MNFINNKNLTSSSENQTSHSFNEIASSSENTFLSDSLFPKHPVFRSRTSPLSPKTKKTSKRNVLEVELNCPSDTDYEITESRTKTNKDENIPFYSSSKYNSLCRKINLLNGQLHEAHNSSVSLESEKSELQKQVFKLSAEIRKLKKLHKDELLYTIREKSHEVTKLQESLESQIRGLNRLNRILKSKNNLLTNILTEIFNESNLSRNNESGGINPNLLLILDKIPYYLKPEQHTTKNQTISKNPLSKPSKILKKSTIYNKNNIEQQNPLFQPAFKKKRKGSISHSINDLSLSDESPTKSKSTFKTNPRSSKELPIKDKLVSDPTMLLLTKTLVNSSTTKNKLIEKHKILHFSPDLWSTSTNTNLKTRKASSDSMDVPNNFGVPLNKINLDKRKSYDFALNNLFQQEQSDGINNEISNNDTVFSDDSNSRNISTIPKTKEPSEISVDYDHQIISKNTKQNTFDSQSLNQIKTNNQSLEYQSPTPSTENIKTHIDSGFSPPVPIKADTKRDIKKQELKGSSLKKKKINMELRKLYSRNRIPSVVQPPETMDAIFNLENTPKENTDLYTNTLELGGNNSSKAEYNLSEKTFNKTRKDSFPEFPVYDKNNEEACIDFERNCLQRAYQREKKQ